MKSTILLAASFLLLVLGADASPLPLQNLVVNGNFKSDLQGWRGARQNLVALRSEGGRTWLAITNNGSVTQTIPLDPEWECLHLAMRMRVTDVVRGAEGWHNARLAMSFSGQNGKRLDPWPNVFSAQGTSDWVQYQRDFKIPAGAARLEFSPSMFGVSGCAEFADLMVTVVRTRGGAAIDLPLPAGADDLAATTNVWRQSSQTRETICLNGLWRFNPEFSEAPKTPPGSNRGWGWFKVPGVWPQSSNGDQKFLMPPGFDDADLLKLEQAWYQRPLNLPASWNGRRILLDFTMVQTYARVLVDGHPAGEVFFPGGLLDITALARPGGSQVLTVLLVARPLEREANVFMAPDRIITSKASLKNKGLTGDVFLRSQPMAEALGDVHVITSTRQNTIAFDTALSPTGRGQRRLEARIYDQGKLVQTFAGNLCETAVAQTGRIAFTNAWADARRWDLDSPRNLYTAVVTLRDEKGKVVDESLPIQFGFREFWIQGRDFFLNGSRIHLRPIFLKNVAEGADAASVEGSRNTCRRLKEYGFNAFITSNYSFEPGEVSYLDGLYQAADEEGVLSSFTLPHAKDFGWKLNTPEQLKRYRVLCEWLVRRAQNHPGIILYAMTHNATGYKGDQNPLWMDGLYSPDDEWARTNPAKSKNRQQALLAAKAANEFDATRPVYHHQSGNLGELYTVNIYLNWAPLQERSDWLEHWGTHGVKPMFFVEWGLPHVSSWSSFRGPQFIWRFPAPQSIWDSEFAAAYLGQPAYQMTPTKVKSMAWEEDLWAGGKPMYWSQLIRYFRSQDENYTQIQALFAADNWRSHRAWGISAMLPWDQENLWRLPAGANQPLPVKQPYQGLQSPGIYPDQIFPVKSEWLYCRDVSKVKPSALGEIFLRWNQPLCAYLAGGEMFTEKGHTFRAGDVIQKKLAILNDTRRSVACRYQWSLAGTTLRASGSATVEPGGIAFQPVRITLPPTLAAGRYPLSASFDFGPGGQQEDSLVIDILPALAPVVSQSRIALFDPKGDTGRLLQDLGIRFTQAVPGQPINGDVLVIGRQALSTNGPLPGFDQVAKGLKILVFEQDAEVLTSRFGFHINVQGLRQVFARVPSHPALTGLSDQLLCNWQGAATIVSPFFDLKSVEENDPKWNWCGFTNTRVWRAGNRGSVATVLIEKPPRGDYLPIVDGGFDLQFSPLLEYVAGDGRVIFCQLDVTGRTQSDPAAQTLCANLLRYLKTARPSPARPTRVTGDSRVQNLLQQLGISTSAEPVANGRPANSLLVLGPGSTVPVDLRKQVEAGLNVLCLGLNQAEIDQALPGLVRGRQAQTVSGGIARYDLPALAGLSDAELHWRTRPDLTALEEKTEQSNEALRVLPMGKGLVVFCQSAPWMFDYAKHPYLRTTYRRNVFLISRLLHNLGAAHPAPELGGQTNLYIQKTQAEDDPYRYYRW